MSAEGRPDKGIQLFQTVAHPGIRVPALGHAGAEGSRISCGDRRRGQVSELVGRPAGRHDGQRQPPASALQQRPPADDDVEVGVEELHRADLTGHQTGMTPHTNGQHVLGTGGAHPTHQDVIDPADVAGLEADLGGRDVISQGGHRRAGEQVREQYGSEAVLKYGPAPAR
ncbi:hypothetical protein [Streptomyces paromomycinus]|uniref:hypothetical protein n=1 Tax=Streptomyces paromomycinus TaxID=92743 RepID=UPI000F6253BA|nr:hypothetical protein [Streptomyces paromomycinus]